MTDSITFRPGQEFAGKIEVNPEPQAITFHIPAGDWVIRITKDGVVSNPIHQQVSHLSMNMMEALLCGILFGIILLGMLIGPLLLQ